MRHSFIYSLLLIPSPALTASLPTTISVHITTTHTILHPRIEITIPPIIIPSITISEFKYTHSKFSLKSLSLNLPTPTCVQTIVPDKKGHVPPGTCNALWNYYPSFVAAVVTAGIFGAITLVHIAEAIYFKTSYSWVISMGLFWETIGFTFRALSAKHQQSSGLLTMSQLSILLAPLWMNAFSYLILTHMIHFYHPTQHLLSLRAPTFSTLFIPLDILCFIIQLIGGSMAGVGAPPQQMQTGLNIYKAGIALQELFVVLFIGLAVNFQLTMRRLELEYPDVLPMEKRTWRRLLYAVYASLVFISARIVFRLVEFSHGTTADNQILNVEWYQYVFDSIPIFFAGFVFVVCHPGMYMQGPDSVIPVARWRRRCAGRRRGKEKVVVDDDGYDAMLLTMRGDISTGRR
ncbi:hypothetical protein ONS95_004695 [Cadophora gregata]|uniref:uncharacterized protein n=1 Tax=Cadophora gregata TaxID=51156 RepID=UPI0026DA7D35|nr:uncharacterized protein ONS95_004695 [Cadophora gregata]KAK0099487.1 hypothetical protein ONS96_008324 [Cadophora gregata f. sp. sojae]KAK0104400.1 hypothetical protein ONS95_004695 [Cadophora gregata]